MEPINELKIAFSSDHAGFDLKNAVINYLKQKCLETFQDFGAYSTESSDYPDFAHRMATAVENGEYDFGVTCCGTGNGVNITANRHHGIRSALCWQPEIATLARAHNNANVLAMPARFISENEAFAIVDAFFSTDFEGGRHQRRIEKIEI